MHSSSVQYVSPRRDRATRVACVQVGGQGGRTDKLKTTEGGWRQWQEGERWNREPVNVREREDEVNSESVSSSE